MYGSSDVEAAQIDMITEHIRDIKDKYSKAKSLPADEKVEGLKKWFATDLNEWLVKLDKSLPATRSPGFAVGSKTSYADITIWAFLTEFFDDKDSVDKAVASCEGLKSIISSVAALPALIAYLAARPITPF